MDIFLVLHHFGFLLHFYITQLIRFAALSLVLLILTLVNVTKFKQQKDYRYHLFRKTFSTFNRRHFDVVSILNVRLKSFLKKRLPEPEFNGEQDV